MPPALPQGDGVEMHALEVTRRLVFLGIADSAKGMLGFQRNPPQGITRKGNGRIGEIAPVLVAKIMQMRRMIKRKSDALKGDQAIGELVLDRLELADRLPELLAFSGVIHDEVERPPRRAISTRHQS